MRIAFLYLPGRRQRLTPLARQEAPSEFFYGAAELAAGGHEIEHFELSEAPVAKRLAAVWDRLRRAYLTPPKMFGHALVNAWALSPKLEAFDCVVATTGHHAFALAACGLLGRFRRPLVAIQCGLLHHPYSAFRKAVTRALLDRMHSVVFGEAEREPTLAALGCDPARFTVNQFGVDLRFWSPDAQPRENFVLAIGNDARRDYPTLLAAAPAITAPIQLITRLSLPAPLPANVTLRRGSWHERAFSDQEIRDLYRRAACVVTPLQDSLQPAGQSVTLQAMACGTPVVLTRTVGLWNPAVLRDGGNVRLVPPADPAAVAAAVNATLDDRAAARCIGEAGRQSVLAHGDIAAFARGLAAACERAIACP